jgi:hypothetical protein
MDSIICDIQEWCNNKLEIFVLVKTTTNTPIFRVISCCSCVDDSGGEICESNDMCIYSSNKLYIIHHYMWNSCQPEGVALSRRSSQLALELRDPVRRNFGEKRDPWLAQEGRSQVSVFRRICLGT